MGATEKDLSITRQNQSANVRELLKEKGLLNLLSTYEIMVYVQLWVDFCLEGPTSEVKKRFQAFDKIMEDRKSFHNLELQQKELDAEKMKRFKEDIKNSETL
ncbi:hypothetical protein UFOVP185_16 [uncultured Caudovirales phage]|uniref:Uncharacterized protein n=1 Tax=uncultured Caudovirales phage TaxID=2100421 RepID=A0A6J7WLB7_9CAUD|nr:hypothetical protein UFOVP185_16 [uncultured Caudovirales phage]